jgi:hypothetical protein
MKDSASPPRLRNSRSRELQALGKQTQPQALGKQTQPQALICFGLNIVLFSAMLERTVFVFVFVFDVNKNETLNSV